jgi:hypothetical protein
MSAMRSATALRALSSVAGVISVPCGKRGINYPPSRVGLSFLSISQTVTVQLCANPVRPLRHSDSFLRFPPSPLGRAPMLRSGFGSPPGRCSSLH